MRFSVIIPIYNAEKYLRECLDSLLAQTCPDFEAVLVDDGSRDNSGAICDEYAARDAHFRVIHKANGGSTSARKAAAASAVGDYILPLDSDDFLHPATLQKLSDAVDAYAPPVVCYGHCEISENGEKTVPFGFDAGYYDRTRIEEAIEPYLLRSASGKHFIPNLWGKIYRREAFIAGQDKVDERIYMGEDACVVIPLILNASSLCIIDEPLYHYRITTGSITNNRTRGLPFEDIRLRAEHFRRVWPEKKKDGLEEQLNRMIVHNLFVVAKTHLRTDKPYALAKKEILTAFSDPAYEEAIRSCRFTSASEKVAAFAVKHRLIFLIRLYAVWLG